MVLLALSDTNPWLYDHFSLIFLLKRIWLSCLQSIVVNATLGLILVLQKYGPRIKKLETPLDCTKTISWRTIDEFQRSLFNPNQTPSTKQLGKTIPNQWPRSTKTLEANVRREMKWRRRKTGGRKHCPTSACLARHGLLETFFVTYFCNFLYLFMLYFVLFCLKPCKAGWRSYKKIKFVNNLHSRASRMNPYNINLRKKWKSQFCVRNLSHIFMYLDCCKFKSLPFSHYKCIPVCFVLIVAY